MTTVLTILDLQDVDEFVEIRRDAFRTYLIAVDDHGHARDAWHVGAADRQRFDVEGTAPEQRGDSIEHARLIFDEGYECVMHLPALGFWL